MVESGIRSFGPDTSAGSETSVPETTLVSSG
jgi:hypothetical protein